MNFNRVDRKVAFKDECSFVPNKDLSRERRKSNVDMYKRQMQRESMRLSSLEASRISHLISESKRYSFRPDITPLSSTFTSPKQSSRRQSVRGSARGNITSNFKSSEYEQSSSSSDSIDSRTPRRLAAEKKKVLAVEPSTVQPEFTVLSQSNFEVIID